ncbi:MAG: YigZ family protein [Bacteroidales bacterium]|nr:YigZ family protein [Bacteroidales bacterium]
MELLNNDTYKTISNTSVGLFKDRGSKFIALAIPVNNENEIIEQLDKLKKEYHNARHHCYAYRLGFDKSVYRINDDGEPSGTAGKPIFGQIRSKDLTNILIVVIRYFGGVKLGVGGLINAYKTASKEAIEKSAIITKTVNDIYEIIFDYSKMNEVMKILKEENLKQLCHSFELICKISFSVRKNDSSRIFNKIKKINNLKINYLRTI